MVAPVPATGAAGVVVGRAVGVWVTVVTAWVGMVMLGATGGTEEPEAAAESVAD